ncbi:MAG: DUF418 domain-containing protein [Gammaproteobacteria bacterium]|nr:DUF418 domain-containing protein [Gammaproteobacteria bacterium]MYG95779.1 DUF418 domain-containing protein [Gammaproteobacteria bacterium]
MLRAMSESTHTIQAPVSGKARIRSIDTLRGVALLGILVINILAFAQPFGSMFDPRVDGATEGANFALFAGAEIFVEGGMRAIFSMLFGAGLLIFMNKPGADAGEVRGLYYRRTGLLVLFGLFNAYALLWVGDILYIYGMTGLLLFLFRNLSPNKLLFWAIGVLLFTTLIHVGLHYSLRQLGEIVAEAQALGPGAELTELQRESVQAWDAMLAEQGLSEAGQAEEVETRHSGYVDNFVFSASLTIYMQTIGLLVFGLWDTLGMMLLGMALMKWRVFDASRSIRFYLLLMLLGFGVGLPLNAWETMTFVESGYQLHWQSINRPTYDLGRLSLALGYIGLVMVVCRSGVLTRLQAALANVGRMALTNYLMQTIICNLVFLGIGFGQFAAWDRSGMYLFVLGVWLFQIVFSHIWLRHYRFGPFEWLWRSLTYRRRQPMLEAGS